MSTTRAYWFLTIAVGLVVLLPGCRKKPDKVHARAHQVNNAAFWNGAVWFIETSGEVTETGATAGSRLVRLEAEVGKAIEIAAELEDVEAWLMAGEDRLWIISTNHTGYYKDGKVTSRKLDEPLEHVSRPFLHKGRPAVIASEPSDYRLMVWEDDKWQQRQKLALRLPIQGGESTGEYLEAFEHEGVLHVFCQVPLQAPVFHHRGLPLAETDQKWEKVADAPGQWAPACLEGKLALFYHADRGKPLVVGVTRRDGQWEEFFVHRVGLDIGLGVCPTGKGGEFILLRRILPLDIEIISVKEGKPAWTLKAGGETNLHEVVIRKALE